TYGLFKEMEKKSLQNLVYQLIDQGLLDRTPGDRPLVRLSAGSMAVLRGQQEVQLVDPGTGTVKRTKLDEKTWQDVDRGLFEHLRELRKEIAAERSVPAFVIFGDAVLRELAAVRPASVETFARIR